MALLLRRCRIIQQVFCYGRYGSLELRKRALECDVGAGLSTSAAWLTLKDDSDDEPNKKIGLDASISVVGVDNKPMGTMALGRATKLAMAKGLKLVQQPDQPHNTTPVYKLMTSGEVQRQRIAEKDKAKDGKASSKSISLMTRITDHDLNTKTSAIKKWLAKGHTVQVTISLASANSPPQDLEKVFKAVESNTKSEGKVLQKREKGGVLKFNLQPQELPEAAS